MNKHSDVPDSVGKQSVDKHLHVHAFTHALATAGQVYADTISDLVTSRHPPEWQHALDEYDRTHPPAHPHLPFDDGTSEGNGPREQR